MFNRFLFLTLLFSFIPENVYSNSELTQKSKKDLIKQMYHMGAIKLEQVTLKSGAISPIYFDMRMIISDPQALAQLAGLMEEQIAQCSCDLICGVPYAAVPLTTAIALCGNYRMIMQRKEAKNYGTKKLIEGRYCPGDRCVIIEDVITTGSSILETVSVLEQHGLQINDIFVIIDRQQSGVAQVQRKGYRVHPLFTLTEVLQILLDQNCITAEQSGEIKKSCSDTQS